MSSFEKPIAKLGVAIAKLGVASAKVPILCTRIGPRSLGRRKQVYLLTGVEAKVDGAGMQMRAITLGNMAYLTIVGPGFAITRELKGRARTRQGVQFAAQVNAAVKILAAASEAPP